MKSTLNNRLVSDCSIEKKNKFKNKSIFNNRANLLSK